ncbi:MAG: hypothetical protein QOG23_1429 [Blastocatellia bacterium]|jgi:outer membrane protein assembly factor BamB|nr:hypothetical protein [Blastocatellia bacterium]
MKNGMLLAVVALVSFVGGLTIHSTSQAQRNPNQDSAPASSPTPCPQADEFPKLIEDMYVTKFNGKRLDLDYGAPFISDDLPHAIDAAKVTALSDGGLIVSIGDTLVRFNAQGHLVWRNPLGEPIFDYGYVDSTNLIYGTAMDNTMFVLDAADGKELTANSRNGSAWYGVAEKYGTDMCLVTDNFRWYRERDWHDKMEPIKDGITCWRRTTILWHQDFPPDAKLIVSGKRILAVTKSNQAIYVNEITPPQDRAPNKK